MKINRTITFGIVILAGIVAGSAATYGYIRAEYMAHHPHTHYHANFAIYVDGTKVDLSAAKYMEDVGACSVGEQTTARERTHLHNGVGDVVHVHDEHVTWNDFLKNIGFFADRNVLVADNGTVHAAGNGKSVKYILNGKAVDDPTNEFIGDQDRLLISYGSEKEADLITGQFTTVPSTAHEHNSTHDPATCKGGEEEHGFIFWK